jgi:hypothetical protein
MRKSLNQLRSEFDTLVAALEMPRSFYWGQWLDAYEDQTVQHPLVCVTLTNATMERDVVSVQVTITVSDKVYDGDLNEHDVESDTLRILRDVHQCMLSRRWRNFLTGQVEQTANATRFYYRGGDITHGWFASYTLRIAANWDLCAIPINPSYDFDQTFTPTCDAATLVVNESLTLQISSGGTLDFSVVDQNGDLTGSWDGEKWVVTGGGICLPATVELNGIEVANPASGATVDIPVIQDGNPVGSWNGTEWVVPACPPPTCDPADWTLENTLAFTLDTGTIPSGGSQTIVAPDGNLDIRDSSNNPIFDYPVPSGFSDMYNVADSTVNVQKSNNALISAVSVLAAGSTSYNVADSDVNVNGALFEAVPATETLNISVRKSTGNDEIGSKQGQFWRIPDSPVTVNGNAFADVKATEAQEVPVQYRNNNTAGKIESGVVRIPQCGVIGKTGQTTSYAANDDGARQEGEGVDLLTLEEINAFGNTSRFTDTLGGQTYANNIVLDHLYASCKKRIIPGYFRTPQSAATWATVMGLQPFTLGGFSEWYVPNGRQLELIISGQNGLNYSPFNIGVNLLTSSTSPFATTNVRSYVAAQGAMGNPAKTSAQSYIGFRYFTYAELGITP